MNFLTLSMHKYIYMFTVLCVCFSCQTSNSTHNNPVVYVMYSPDCPLCKNYTLDLKNLIASYGEYIDFYAVIPGNHYANFEVDSFLNSYDLRINIIYDDNFELVDQLGATITPEVYFIDEEGEILYSGKFDNWLGELGRRRQIVTEYYLENAIQAYLNNTVISIKKTNPIGCFIE